MKIKNSIRPLSRASAIMFPLVLIILGVFSCNKSDDDQAPEYSIKITTNAALGDILTDSEGRTLYYFANDFDGTSACNSATCLASWPIFHHKEDLTIHPDLIAADFATITRADGTLQTTYKGWPLYYFSKSGKQEGPGKTEGNAIQDVWYVVKTDYALMYMNAQLIRSDGTHYKSDFTVGDGLTRYYSNDHGRTIYRREGDRNGVNLFTNATYANTATWPLFYVDIENLSFPGTILKTDFGVITVGPENRKQLTYKGWPLYYYGPDELRGNNKGESLPVAAPIWHILSSTTASAPN